MSKVILAVLFALVAVSFSNHAVAQTGPDTLYWGINGDSSFASGGQGGFIELGQSPSGVNPVTGGVPFIDFHYGNGQAEDYNYRIINYGDQMLGFQSKAQATTGRDTLQLESNSAKINGGLPYLVSNPPRK